MQPDFNNPVRDRAPQPVSRRSTQIRDLGNTLKSFEFIEGFHRGPRRRSARRTAAWSWAAALLDSILIIGLCLILLGTSGWLLRFSAEEIWRQLQREKALLAALIFLMTSFSYLVCARTFLGCSFGEWACGLKLGPINAYQTKYYVQKVVLRTALIMATGILPIPLLSFVFGVDLAGFVSGLRLVNEAAIAANR